MRGSARARSRNIIPPSLNPGSLRCFWVALAWIDPSQAIKNQENRPTPAQSADLRYPSHARVQDCGPLYGYLLSVTTFSGQRRAPRRHPPIAQGRQVQAQLISQQEPEAETSVVAGCRRTTRLLYKRGPAHPCNAAARRMGHQGARSAVQSGARIAASSAAVECSSAAGRRDRRRLELPLSDQHSSGGRHARRAC